MLNYLRIVGMHGWCFLHENWTWQVASRYYKSFHCHCSIKAPLQKMRCLCYFFVCDNTQYSIKSNFLCAHCSFKKSTCDGILPKGFTVCILSCTNNVPRCTLHNLMMLLLLLLLLCPIKYKFYTWIDLNQFFYKSRYE